MSYSRNVPVVVEWSDEQKQVHIRDIDDTSPASPDWKMVCTCTDEAGAMAVGDLLTERAALREELDRAEDLLEALKALAGCIEGYPDMMAEPAVAECMATALEALEAVGVSDE